MAEHRTGHNPVTPPPEQWTGESMHKVCEVYHQKCFDDNDDVNIALLQMKSTPIGAGLPIRALLPQMNREPISNNADGEHYEVLKTCQDKYLKGNDACKDSLLFPIRSTVAVQHEYGGSRTHGVVEEANSTYHSG